MKQRALLPEQLNRLIRQPEITGQSRKETLQLETVRDQYTMFFIIVSPEKKLVWPAKSTALSIFGQLCVFGDGSPMDYWQFYLKVVRWYTLNCSFSCS